ncbi:MAG TPA: type I-E CRISPR-associated endoribonuclease Cas2e [Sphaerochaeta sp.]|jgi:CRISPR-associated protein Cas2|nr:type I-E CRISPR-associated endoribonuclease Cas2e [Spirochaetota bacterium]TAH57211.1 MAG: type I-E CRISPR-associated endoribonuclease Cas2 [Sphaerochaeta sp.]HOE90013.1 type I-E CRISPR-associated endoribonuclease Cas2e [Sphaerochaeta sp.]HPK63839.1 type I-E CRISPR-associated endoribonuclease Cas2e [Sphaerochaeta sp.]
MVVVIANDLPPAVRGRMKLWFIEPRANVFVSGIKDSVATKVVKYLINNCPPSSGLLVLQRINTPPFYKIWGVGDTSKKIALIDGFQLIFEKIAQE